VRTSPLSFLGPGLSRNASFIPSFLSPAASVLLPAFCYSFWFGLPLIPYRTRVPPDGVTRAAAGSEVDPILIHVFRHWARQLVQSNFFLSHPIVITIREIQYLRTATFQRSCSEYSFPLQSDQL
jgi:hypothetical protein